MAILERLGAAAFDLQELLARVEGDRDLLADLVSLLRSESPRLLSEIRRCIETADSAGLGRATHELKGSLSNFGGQASVDAATVLERMGGECAFTGAGLALTRLEQEVARLQDALATMDLPGSTPRALAPR